MHFAGTVDAVRHPVAVDAVPVLPGEEHGARSALLEGQHLGEYGSPIWAIEDWLLTGKAYGRVQ